MIRYKIYIFVAMGFAFGAVAQSTHAQITDTLHAGAVDSTPGEPEEPARPVRSAFGVFIAPSQGETRWSGSDDYIVLGLHLRGSIHPDSGMFGGFFRVSGGLSFSAFSLLDIGMGVSFMDVVHITGGYGSITLAQGTGSAASSEMGPYGGPLLGIGLQFSHLFMELTLYWHDVEKPVPNSDGYRREPTVSQVVRIGWNFRL